jgi:hypothetical protein
MDCAFIPFCGNTRDTSISFQAWSRSAAIAPNATENRSPVAIPAFGPHGLKTYTRWEPELFARSNQISVWLTKSWNLKRRQMLALDGRRLSDTMQSSRFKIFHADANSIISRTSGVIAKVGFTHSLNPARNGSFGCTYRYLPTMPSPGRP